MGCDYQKIEIRESDRCKKCGRTLLFSEKICPACGFERIPILDILHKKAHEMIDRVL